MAGELNITVVGNLGNDPELRYTQNGVAFCNFNIAQTPRFFDKQSNEWKDGDAVWMRCTAWRDLAEHIAQTFTKGTRALVTGQLTQRSYEDAEGNRKTAYGLTVEDMGPSVKFATAQVVRANRDGQQGGGFGNWGQPQQAQGQPGWGQPAAPQGGGQQPAQQPSTGQGGLWGQGAQQNAPQGDNPWGAGSGFEDEQPF